MYKLSTSEFGIAQQYVHVQSVDVPDEVITYNAEGTSAASDWKQITA